MDPLEIMEWFEDNDEVLASLQNSIFLILKQQASQNARGGSKFGRCEIYRNRRLGHQQLYDD